MSEQRVTDVELREMDEEVERHARACRGDPDDCDLTDTWNAVRSALAAVNRADEGDSRLRDTRQFCCGLRHPDGFTDLSGTHHPASPDEPEGGR